jgi:hypothetical protein
MVVPPERLRKPLSGTEEQLSHIKALGELAWGIGLDSPDAHQALKGVFRKPLLVALRGETCHQMLDLTITNTAIKWHEKVGRSEVAVVLWNLIFKDQVIAPSVPAELVQDAVVLMEVIPRMGEDNVRRQASFQGLEVLLDPSAFKWKKTVTKIEDFDVPRSSAFQEQGGTVSSFALAVSSGAEDHPVKMEVSASSQQLQDGAATADLNVVGMRTKAEDLQRPASILEVKSKHLPSQCPFIHTCQGALPLA